MTIPIDPRFVPAFSIETVLLDKDTGAPLSGGQVYFEEDNQRGILKPVYQITGNSPNYTFTQLPNPMTLSAIGTFQDALDNPVIPYFFPFDTEGNVDLYYIRVLSSGLVPQFTREAQPFVGDTGETDVLSVITNEMSNPQFVQVNFNTATPNFVYTVNTVSSQVINIAPDWDLVVTAPGAGTITVNQLDPAGTLNVPTNPATLLNINSAGLTQLLLRQRIFGSPNLWGNGFIAGSFVGRTHSGTTIPMTMYYSQSNGTVMNVPIATGSFPSSDNYIQISGSTALVPISNSPDTNPNAYIDIFFVLPLSIEIDITSVMIAFTGETSIDDINYDQESVSRQIDHLFHYYQPKLNFKPIPSLLTGWDFALNPAQNLGTTLSVGTSAQYAWDQTIMAASSSTVNVTRTSAGALSVVTTAGTQAFYLLQYLSGQQALEFVLSRLSVNLQAMSITNPGVVARVYLFIGNGSSSIPTLSTTIGTIANTGVFTLTAANWSAVTQPDGNASSGTLVQSTLRDFGFSGWNPIGMTPKNFAIVVTFAVPTSGTGTIVQSISCVPGDIPTRPAPQTFDEVQRECQFYYESSYAAGVAPGTVAATNIITLQGADTDGAVTARGWATAFSLKFNTYKRAAPNLVLYSPDSALANKVTMNLYTDATVRASTVIASTNWTLSVGQRAFDGIANTSSDLTTGATGGVNIRPFGIILYHYSADARLGVV